MLIAFSFEQPLSFFYRRSLISAILRLRLSSIYTQACTSSALSEKPSFTFDALKSKNYGLIRFDDNSRIYLIKIIFILWKNKSHRCIVKEYSPVFNFSWNYPSGSRVVVTEKERFSSQSSPLLEYTRNAKSVLAHRIIFLPRCRLSLWKIYGTF